MKYDDSNKSKVTLGGEGGTTITNVKDGVLSDSSTEAVNGKQLYNEQQAREAADKVITEKVTNNTTEITKIENGEGFTDKGKEVIRELAKGSVKVIAGTNTTVTPGSDKDGAKTYAVNVEGNGKVASDDRGLISGDTLYKEVHVDKDGSYIKGSNQSVKTCPLWTQASRPPVTSSTRTTRTTPSRLVAIARPRRSMSMARMAKAASSPVL